MSQENETQSLLKQVVTVTGKCKEHPEVNSSDFNELVQHWIKEHLLLSTNTSWKQIKNDQA